MANKRINELALRTPQTTDLMLIGDPTTGYSYKATLAAVTANLVPYTGATSNLNLGEYGLSGGFVSFDTTPTGTPAGQGTMYWDASEETVALIMNGTTQHIGQDTFYYVKNSTGATIAKGSAVGFAGTDGNSGHLLVKKFQANGVEPSQYYMGITAEEIANGAFGKVMKFGKLEGVNTSAFADGNILYVSTSVAGGFQTTVPTAPNNIIVAAAVISAANNGKLMVRETLGSNINNDEGVKITTPTNGQVLKYNSTSGLWENSTDNNSVTSVFGRTGAVVAQSGDYTTTQVTEGTNLYYTNARARGSISLTTTGTSGAATYNSSTGVLNIPNYAPDLSAYVQGSGTANYIPKFTAASTIANSQIEDNGTSVGIGYAGSTPSLYLLDVNGESRFTDDLRVQSTTGNRKIRVRSGGSVGIELADTRVTTGKTWSIENGVTSGLLGFYESSSAKFSLTTAGNGEFAGTLKASISALATASNAYVVSDGGVLKSRTAAEVLSDIGGQAALTNPITGTGTANYVSKFTASGTIGNSTIYDNGTFVGIGTTTEIIGAGKLQVNGGGYFNGSVGIGVSPLTKLHVAYDADFSLRIDGAGSIAQYRGNTSTGGLEISTNLTSGTWGTNGGFISFSPRGTEALRLASTGAATFSSSVTATQYTATSSAGSGLRIYGASGTNQWDMYLNGANIRFSDNTGTGKFVVDRSIMSANLLQAANDGVRLGELQSGYYLLDVNDSNGLGLRTGGSGFADLVISPSGQIGIGVTPSAWGTTNRVIETTAGTSMVGRSDFSVWGRNFYYNSSDAGIYTANGHATAYFQESGKHIWSTSISGSAGGAVSFTQAMTLNASGNLGLGVTPSAWSNDFGSVLQFKSANSQGGGALTGSGGSNFRMFANTYYDGSYRYIVNGTATQYEQDGGHRWYIAPSGTAGAAITFTQAMTLNASGRLLLGTTTDNLTDLLQVAGSGRFAGTLKLTPGVGNNYILLDHPGVQTWYQKITTANNSSFIISNDYLGGTNILTLAENGAATFASTIKTAAPTGYTAKPWKLGNDQGFGTNHTPTRSINVEIDGTVYFLQAVAASDI